MTPQEQKAANDAAKLNPGAAKKAKATDVKNPIPPITEPTPEEIEAAKKQQDQISKDVETKRARELANKAVNDGTYNGKLPSVGRTVHFFPNQDDVLYDVRQKFLAAIVVKAWGNHRCDLRILPSKDTDAKTLRQNIPHASKSHSLVLGGAFWDWPQLT